MKRMMKQMCLPALKLFLVLTLVTGVIYPLAVTLVSQGVFKEKADGSLISRKGVVVGSELLQQDFQKSGYFHGRPQDVTNLSPQSEKLKKLVEDRAKLGLKNEMLYASASGLDPEIRPRSAYDQVDRIAAERKLDPMVVKALVAELTIRPDFGFIGEHRVNVLKLNLRLDELTQK